MDCLPTCAELHALALQILGPRQAARVIKNCEPLVSCQQLQRRRMPSDYMSIFGAFPAFAMESMPALLCLCDRWMAANRRLPFPPKEGT